MMSALLLAAEQAIIDGHPFWTDLFLILAVLFGLGCVLYSASAKAWALLLLSASTTCAFFAFLVG